MTALLLCAGPRQQAKGEAAKGSRRHGWSRSPCTWDDGWVVPGGWGLERFGLGEAERSGVSRGGESSCAT
jgi:hypothetical protein